MKIKSGFLVRKIADSYMAVPIKERTKTVSGVIALSDTGAFLWKQLKVEIAEEQLVEELMNEYDVEQELAIRDVEAFLLRLKEQGWLDETSE